MGHTVDIVLREFTAKGKVQLWFKSEKGCWIWFRLAKKYKCYLVAFKLL